MNLQKENRISLSERSSKSIWHPFTQMKMEPHPCAIVRGEGALLFDDSGKSYIDAISSWWVNLHGHAHPYIAEKVSAQLKQLEHVIFAGFTHAPAVELAEALLSILPDNQRRVFFSDDGSTAVEVALKMAIQYWHNRGTPRNTFIALRNGYHGDTVGAMSVAERGEFNRAFWPLLFETHYITAPYPGDEEKSICELGTLLKSKPCAGFIFEPLIQGASGMRMYEPCALDALLQLCSESGVITIADEVMTGFGRTGKMFAAEYLRLKPDIVALAKGLTGGTMPLGATTCTAEIFNAFFADERPKMFHHGHSYTANPLACTAALANLDLLRNAECDKQIKLICAQHQSFAAELRGSSCVQGVRTLGTVFAFDIVTGEQPSYYNSIRDFVYRYSLERGVLLRPLGNTVYILPPYCISKTQLGTVYDVIRGLLKEISKGRRV